MRNLQRFRRIAGVLAVILGAGMIVTAAFPGWKFSHTRYHVYYIVATGPDWMEATTPIAFMGGCGGVLIGLGLWAALGRKAGV